jgi:hypothetical protein
MRLRNLERQAALTMVAIALLQNELERGSCENCGTDRFVCVDPISTNPLRVNWRCRRCANAMRRRERKEMRIDFGAPFNSGERPPIWRGKRRDLSGVAGSLKF